MRQPPARVIGGVLALTVAVGAVGFREVWEVTYDANPAEPGYSKLAFDENYNLLTSSVRPEDQDEFQPLLDAFLDP